MFYGALWPSGLQGLQFLNILKQIDPICTKTAADRIRNNPPDAIFDYIGVVDIAGHGHGAASEKYLWFVKVNLTTVLSCLIAPLIIIDLSISSK